MSVNVLHTDDGWYAVRDQRAVRVRTAAATTAELLADRDAVTAAVNGTDPGVPVADLAVLSPITPGCRVVAQMANFVSHANRPPSVPKNFRSACNPPTHGVRTGRVQRGTPHRGLC